MSFKGNKGYGKYTVIYNELAVQMIFDYLQTQIQDYQR